MRGLPSAVSAAQVRATAAIRDESGMIVSVTTLETVADAEGCAWAFVASVPESEFYAISIPMEFEQVFPGAMVAESDGEVMIELP